MNARERRVMADLLTEVRKRQTKAGHASIIVTTERLGYCHWRGGHGATCQRLTNAITAAEALLAESLVPIPIQGTLALDQADGDRRAVG